MGDSTPHTPRIKHQALSSNQPFKSEYEELSLSQTLFHIDTQAGVDWAEPGFGTQAYWDGYRDCSRAGEGLHCWSLIGSRRDCSCVDFPYRSVALEWFGEHREICGCQYGLRYGRNARKQIFSAFDVQFR